MLSTNRSSSLLKNICKRPAQFKSLDALVGRRNLPHLHAFDTQAERYVNIGLKNLAFPSRLSLSFISYGATNSAGQSWRAQNLLPTFSSALVNLPFPSLAPPIHSHRSLKGFLEFSIRNSSGRTRFCSSALILPTLSRRRDSACLVIAAVDSTGNAWNLSPRLVGCA